MTLGKLRARAALETDGSGVMICIFNGMKSENCFLMLRRDMIGLEPRSLQAGRDLRWSRWSLINNKQKFILTLHFEYKTLNKHNYETEVEKLISTAFEGLYFVV